MTLGSLASLHMKKSHGDLSFDEHIRSLLTLKLVLDSGTTSQFTKFMLMEAENAEYIDPQLNSDTDVPTEQKHYFFIFSFLQSLKSSTILVFVTTNFLSLTTSFKTGTLPDFFLVYEEKFSFCLAHFQLRFKTTTLFEASQ